MAVFCEFSNVIIPISNIEKVYKGGFKQFKIDYSEMFNGRYWYDEYLFRDGAMNSYDIKAICEMCEQKGLVGSDQKDGVKCWKDFCVVTELLGPTLPCDWIVFDSETCSVHHKGNNIGVIVGPNR